MTKLKQIAISWKNSGKFKIRSFRIGCQITWRLNVALQYKLNISELVVVVNAKKLDTQKALKAFKMEKQGLKKILN